MSRKTKLQEKIKEGITNLSTSGRIPADEVQLNLDVAYDSCLDEICAVVPMESPRQVISYLKLKFGSPQKAITKSNKDVIDAAIMNNTGALPLDEFGYITDTVEFTASDSTFIGLYKNILPGSVKIGDNGDITDDCNGNLIDNANGETIVGSVDYKNAVFTTNINKETLVSYKFDIYNIDTSRNMAYFEKASKEVFADMFQFDVDSAVVLNDFKGINLQQNIDKILPEVLAKQIDSFVLSKYFDMLDAKVIDCKDYTVRSWEDENSYTYNLLNVAMGKFAAKTGVIPNVIICDPMGLAVISSSGNYSPLVNNNKDNIESDATYAGTPRKVGYVSGAKVFVTNGNEMDDKKGKIILTYRGPSDAQASGVYSPFIPVTLRTVSGAESGGMISTNNLYSIGGFTIINKDLIYGMTITEIN